MTTENGSAPPSPRGFILIAYGLFLIGMWTGLALSFGYGGLLVDVAGLLGVLVLIAARQAVVGTPYESHATWLTRTFILTLIGFAAGIILVQVRATASIAEPVILIVGLYYVYRVIRGLRFFVRASGVPNPRGWL